MRACSAVRPPRGSAWVSHGSVWNLRGLSRRTNCHRTLAGARRRRRRSARRSTITGGLCTSGLRHQHAALHAARQRAHVGVCLRGQKSRWCITSSIQASLPADAEVARLDAAAVSAHGEERVRTPAPGAPRRSMPPARAGSLRPRSRPSRFAAPESGPRQAGNHVDERGLARRPLGPSRPKNSPLPDREAHARERAHGAEALLELPDLDRVQRCAAAAGSRRSTPYRRAIRLQRFGRLVKETSCWRAWASAQPGRGSSARQRGIPFR